MALRPIRTDSIHVDSPLNGLAGQEGAAVGFKVLAQMAQETQLLLSPNHEHLLEIANTALGGKVSTTYLEYQVLRRRYGLSLPRSSRQNEHLAGRCSSMAVV